MHRQSMVVMFKEGQLVGSFFLLMFLVCRVGGCSGVMDCLVIVVYPYVTPASIWSLDG